MSEVDGATLIARSLKQQGIDHLFGVAPSTSLMFSDRKSTRLNSSHSQISYAVFCLKKKNNISAVVVLGRAEDVHGVESVDDGVWKRNHASHALRFCFMLMPSSFIVGSSRSRRMLAM